jgi:hypothetical protein
MATMLNNWIVRWPALVIVLSLTLSLRIATAELMKKSPREEEAFQIGVDAYIYGYPLVLMDVTRQVATATPKVTDRRAPVNQFRHNRAFPDHTFTTVVSPNADTLYSIAWLDLAKEPMVLSVPDTGKRYYLMQFLDAWTNVFAAPGSRTTGNGKGDFAITGPGWKGKLPPGVLEIKAPTNMVWLIGRTQTNGKDDYAAVHALQRQYKLTPLSAFGTNYVLPDNAPVDPNVDLKTPPVAQVAQMDAATFFGRLARLMKDNPPAAADAEFVKKLAVIGMVVGKDFDKAQDATIAQALEQGVREGRAKLLAATMQPKGKALNGWTLMEDLGRYGTNYLHRATVAALALGANLAEDAVYLRTTVDAAAQPLTGGNRYVLHFARDQTPSVNAFWSVTMYNSKQFFVENGLGRYALGDRDKLTFNPDGSLDIYVQNESPGKDKQANWLPAPKEEFNLILRLYWPKKEALGGGWQPPGIVRGR